MSTYTVSTTNGTTHIVSAASWKSDPSVDMIVFTDSDGASVYWLDRSAIVSIDLKK